jgi:hypothetical protein
MSGEGHELFGSRSYRDDDFDAEDDTCERCGHDESDHYFFSPKEIEKLKTLNIVRFGRCVDPDDSENEVCLWIEASENDWESVFAIFEETNEEAEDPCDEDFMRDISS